MFKLFALLIIIFCAPSFAERGVDPTRPLAGFVSPERVKKEGKLILESIFTRGNSRIAIINGKLLKSGDNIGLYRLNTINAKSVVLNSEQGELELSLFSAEVAIHNEKK